MNGIFVGSGSISLRHLKNWSSLFPLSNHSLVSRSCPSGLSDEVSHYASLEAAIQETPDAKCVFISNPSSMHLKSARESLEKGLHVFCEKPLSNSSEGAKELAELAESKGKVFFVGYNLRFHAPLMRLKELLAANEIGRPLSFFLEVGQYLPDWRPSLDYRKSVSAQKELGGGALLELSHEIDAAIWLAGSEVLSAGGQFGQASDLEVDVEDFASLTLEFANLLTAHLHLDFMQRPGRRSYRLVGTKGSLEWNSLSEGIERVSFESGVSQFESFKDKESGESYILQMERFIDLIQGDGGWREGYNDALQVVKVVEELKHENLQADKL